MFVLNLLAKIFDMILTVVELILSVRFVLIMFNVGSSSQIVAWIYKTSAPLVQPFSGIFEQLKLFGFVIDFSTLFALIVYGLLGMLIVKLISHPMSYN
jgi:uncharacterized protein YggT (Ycf19 family)